MRIQILGVNFGPERTGIAPYTSGLARHLARRHEVTVVTGMPHYPDWRVSPEHRAWRREERRGNLRVIRVGHYVPARMNAASRGLFELTWAAHAGAVGARIPTDVVIAVVPALLGAQAGRLIAKKRKVPYGVIVQDVMGTAAAQSGMTGGRLVAGATSRMESSALRYASSVTTIHPRLADELAAVTGRRPEVIYNWTHVAGRPRPDSALRHRLGWGDDEVIALHSGNMGSKQNLEVLIDAARLAAREGKPVRFVLAGGGSQRARLQAYARGCERVSFLESVDDADYMDLLAAADVLLVNERPGMNEMSLPSKLTSYLVAGRPIVAATDDHSGTAEFVRRSGGGIVTRAGDAGLLLDTIGKVAADDGLAASLVAAGHAFAEERLTEAGAMADYDRWVDGLLASPVR